MTKKVSEHIFHKLAANALALMDVVAARMSGIGLDVEKGTAESYRLLANAMRNAAKAFDRMAEVSE